LVYYTVSHICNISNKVLFDTLLLRSEHGKEVCLCIAEVWYDNEDEKQIDKRLNVHMKQGFRGSYMDDRNNDEKSNSFQIAQRLFGESHFLDI